MEYRCIPHRALRELLYMNCRIALPHQESMNRSCTKILSTHFLASIVILAAVTASHADDEVSFNKQIRPIFINKCTKCHGGVKADGDLSLIYRAEALGKGRSGNTLIVPGKPEESELYQRIITDDIDDKMPLQTGDHAEEPLNPEQVNLIKKWIEQGAKWEDHWAYIKPEIKPMN